jgi:UDPglucose--hexose-1-phosphate uridylyltransferase
MNHIVFLYKMDFIKVLKISRFLDPFQEFSETKRYSEVRHDPLTGHSTRILDFPVKEICKADVSELVEKSRSMCPFCPEVVEQVTPKFHPDLLSKERYSQGEALCVPNVFPYDENGAVCVMTKEHHLPLNDFTVKILTDALSCCFDYLGDVVVKQPGMIYQSVNWNYMPLAGGSIIHPHLQITASSSSTNYYTVMLAALEKYLDKHNSDFWADLRDEEKRLGQRCICITENMTWLVAYAPMGVFDILGIIHNARTPGDINGGTLNDLAGGILNVLNYIDSLNLNSLNMSIYFLLGNSSFTPHLRICPRVSIPPFDTSQINYMKMLHNETLTTLKPEDICDGIKSFWDV